MIRTSAVLIVFLVAARSAAQEAPFVTPLLHASSYALYATSGDLNGDGFVDLVVNDEQDIAVRLGGPLGTFQPELETPAADFVHRMELADLDADGDLDLAATVDAGIDLFDALLVELGGGDGTFTKPVLYASGQNPSDLQVGDMDEDGVLDVAVSDLGSTRVSLFFGTGDGSFEPKVDINAGGHPLALEMGLLDGDAHLDLVVATTDSTLITLKGSGSGGFTALAPAPMGSGASDLDLGDIEADGAQDLLVTFSAPYLQLVHGHGDGTWTAEPAQFMTSTTRRGALIDVDEDGHDDAVFLLTDAILIPEAEGFGVQLSHGDGTLGPMARYGTPLEPFDLVVDDLNHDGELDLVATLPKSFLPVNVFIESGRGDGTFGPVIKTGDAPEELAAGDLDGDGIDDLVVACGSSDAVAIHHGLGHGAYDAVAPLVGMGDFPVGVAVADIVEDGLLDMVVADRHNPGRVVVRAGDGALGFGPPIVTSPGEVPYGMTSGDANLDGHLDLALPGNGSKALIALGDGAGHFTTVDSVTTASVAEEAAAFTDLNLDGLPDIVIASGGAPSVSTAFGQGGGQFGATIMAAAPTSNQHDVAAGDITGDGYPDVVVPGGFWGVVCVYVNNGSGALVLSNTLTSQDPRAVAIADVNGDELPDVVATTDWAAESSVFGALTTWLRTPGGFAPPQDALTGGSLNMASQELLLRDLDGDGAQDAAVLVLEDDDLWILPNQLGPWQDLGQPLAGAQGLPRQAGYGTLLPGAPFEFRLTDSRPSGTTAHVIGLSTLNAPFKGGVFVPSPLFINYPLPLDAQGDLSLAGTWPATSASGVNLYFQFWTADPAGVKGFSASNAVQATLP